MVCQSQSSGWPRSVWRTSSTPAGRMSGAGPSCSGKYSQLGPLPTPASGETITIVLSPGIYRDFQARISAQSYWVWIQVEQAHRMSGLLVSTYNVLLRPVPMSSLFRYSLMLQCWHSSPSQRPNFKTIVNRQEEIILELSQYLGRILYQLTYFYSLDLYLYPLVSTKYNCIIV